MTISGGRTKQLDIFCRITGFTSDFSQFHSCGTYSVLSWSHSTVTLVFWSYELVVYDWGMVFNQSECYIMTINKDQNGYPTRINLCIIYELQGIVLNSV